MGNKRGGYLKKKEDNLYEENKRKMRGKMNRRDRYWMNREEWRRTIDAEVLQVSPSAMAAFSFTFPWADAPNSTDISSYIIKYLCSTYAYHICIYVNNTVQYVEHISYVYTLCIILCSTFPAIRP